MVYIVTLDILTAKLRNCMSQPWYSRLSKKLKKRMQFMQNNVIRYMLNVPPRTHIGVQEFREVGLLPLESRVDQLIPNHMFVILNDCAPGYLKNHIDIVYNQPSYNTRASVLCQGKSQE